ncbi:hypothetical protein [Prescottella equi]|uniref:hypothetical protein n=1 Tax=Rhodococcus hoagii TaxID=43767 RepID=UPI00111C2744|nr:hypothetical protein [Prescottella equi]
MQEFQTLRMRQEFADDLVSRSGGQRGVAKRLGLSVATVNRQLNHSVEPSARFVARVLTICAVPFEEAFVVTDEIEAGRHSPSSVKVGPARHVEVA